MGKRILSVKKITKGNIKLDDSILDYLFLNEGDYLAFVEEDNKIYIRKTRKPQSTTSEPDSEDLPPPPTFEEKATKEPFTGIPNMGNNLFEAVQDALKNPETMKMFQDTAKQLFSAFGDINKIIDPNKTKKEEETGEDELTKEDVDDNSKDEQDENDSEDNDDPEFDVKIE